MINVIHGTSADAFDALVYPDQSVFNDIYIQNQLASFSSTVTDIGRKFLESAKGVYERLQSSEAAQVARHALRSASGMFRANQIVPLQTLEELQAAQPIMQRWVMANIAVRQMYHEQRCDGYSDTYVDIYPKDIGETHYDWRRVMDGVLVESEDGEDWSVKFYLDELVEGDRDLTHSEKCDILNVWHEAEKLLHAGKDPTNPFGGTL